MALWYIDQDIGLDQIEVNYTTGMLEVYLSLLSISLLNCSVDNLDSDCLSLLQSIRIKMHKLKLDKVVLCVDYNLVIDNNTLELIKRG